MVRIEAGEEYVFENECGETETVIAIVDPEEFSSTCRECSLRRRSLCPAMDCYSHIDHDGDVIAPGVHYKRISSVRTTKSFCNKAIAKLLAFIN